MLITRVNINDMIKKATFFCESQTNSVPLSRNLSTVKVHLNNTTITTIITTGASTRRK